MGQTEVTQAQYEAVMGDNPTNPERAPRVAKGIIRDPAHPVVLTTCGMAKEFCRKVAEKTGENVHLPTDEQWEYAARAEGDALSVDALTDVGWFLANSEQKAHAVAQKKPNAYGLHDMLGNAHEWVTTGWLRGGHWLAREPFCQPFAGEPHGGAHHDPWSGFRVVVDSKR